jgi:glycosyltransferase involved in cell wall biosynthesis
MAKISIAIPTWECHGRGEEFLDDLFRTIEVQTFKDFEVVISDHCVDDYLLPKIKEYEEKFEIKYVKNKRKRGNSPANLNKAINTCTGEIIKIIFQDDFFYDDEALEKIYYALSDSDKDWLLNGTNHTKDDGRSFYWDLYPQFNDELLKGVNTISSPSVVSFKNTVKTRFDEKLVYFMDVEFYYAMKEKYGDPVFYNDVLVTNRFPHSHSISNKIKDKTAMMKQETEYCLEKYNTEQ